MWFSIYNLTGCDGKKVVPKKTISEQVLPVGGSYYSLRSKSTEEAESKTFSKYGRDQNIITINTLLESYLKIYHNVKFYTHFT